MHITLAQRFWSKVARRDPDECWPWLAGRDPGGYGRIRLNGKQTGTHRIAWALVHGREPNGFVLHRCDNRRCCNPAHLWLGDQTANMRDMVAKGRHFSPWRGPSDTCRNGHALIPENRTSNGSGRTTCRVCRQLNRKDA